MCLWDNLGNSTDLHWEASIGQVWNIWETRSHVCNILLLLVSLKNIGKPQLARYEIFDCSLIWPGIKYFIDPLVSLKKLHWLLLGRFLERRSTNWQDRWQRWRRWPRGWNSLWTNNSVLRLCFLWDLDNAWEHRYKLCVSHDGKSPSQLYWIAGNKNENNCRSSLIKKNPWSGPLCVVLLLPARSLCRSS